MKRLLLKRRSKRLPASAIKLCILVGMRSIAGIATLQTVLSQRSAVKTSKLHAVLASPQARAVVRAATVGEALADKMPFMSARTAPLPLMGRMAVGGLIGALLADESAATSTRCKRAIMGAAAAGLSAFFAMTLRRQIGQRLRVSDALVGAAEDGIVAALSRTIQRDLR